MDCVGLYYWRGHSEISIYLNVKENEICSMTFIETYISVSVMVSYHTVEYNNICSNFLTTGVPSRP